MCPFQCFLSPLGIEVLQRLVGAVKNSLCQMHPAYLVHRMRMNCSLLNNHRQLLIPEQTGMALVLECQNMSGIVTWRVYLQKVTDCHQFKRT